MSVAQFGAGRGASSLANPLVKAGVMLPSVTGLAYGVATSAVANVAVFVTLIALASVLGGVAALRPWRGPAREQLEQRWQLLCGIVGVAIAPPFIVVAVDVHVELFTLMIAMAIVVGAFSFPRRVRLPLGVWALVMWAVALWWGDVREPWVLLLHLGGGVALLVVCLLLAGALLCAVEVETRSRAASEQSAQLLASVLRTNRLEPAAVIRAVVNGMRDAGFHAVAIREVDEQSGVLRLVDGHGTPRIQLAETLPLADAHLVRQAFEAGRSVVVDEYDRSRATLYRGVGFRGTIVVPVWAGGGPTIVLIGTSTDGPLTSGQVEAATLLAQQASRALERARAYEADRGTAEKLRLLDRRAQDFVSTVSHELRTPLTVVHGLGQTLLRRWDHLEAERRRDLLERVGANAERLAVMVASLLDVSAFERGELALRRQPVLVQELTKAVVHRLETLSTDHPVDVRVPEDLVVDADPSLLDHVLENLLVNVVRHTPAGTSAEVRAQRYGDEVEVSVMDDGPGIPDDDLPHVLDRFYRGGSLTTRPSGGLGLGLALARDVVQLHGATLEVVSPAGEGTTFRFRLPAASPLQPPATAAGSAR